MNVKQVYSLINEVSKQAFGDKAVAIVDATGFVSLGDYVLDSDTTKDKFLNTLVDRIARTVVDNRGYIADDLSIVRDSFEYGAILQRVHVDYMEAKASSQWDLTDGSSVDQYVVTKPTATQKLFSGINTWEVDVTIPDIQLKSAFLNVESMTAFIDGIFMMLDNSMQIQIENSVYTTFNNFVAETINEGNGTARVRHLLTEYQGSATTLTSETAMRDLDFLKFAVTEILKDVKRIAKVSTIYNTDGKKRFTTKENARVTLLNDFIVAVNSYLQADTYNMQLLELPKYTEVVRWQGLVEDVDDDATDVSLMPTFKAVSTINMKISDGTTVNKEYIIGAITDVDAMGVTIVNRRMKSSYNDKGEYTNYFSKADIGYFNDLSHNGIVYILD